MKIRKLQLKNIGVFDDETIEFQPCPVKDKAEIHIFTGQNGSGKSTILMALASIFDNYNGEFHHSKLKNNFSKRFRNTRGENKVSVVFEDSTEASLKVYNGTGYSDYKPFPSNGGSIGMLEEDNKLFIYKAYSTSKPYYRDMLLEFAVFADSGYRQIESANIEAIKEPKWFSPLSQSLNFIKDYTQENEISINQLITNNISKSAIEKDRNKSKSEKFAKVLKSIEQAISEITGWKITFDLQTEPLNLITKINGEELDFDILPDGLRSLISWIADLLGRVDLLSWRDDLPIFEKNLILLLDEIEVHLHPAWQRKVLPVVQKLFKNSQIFVSTHSPFVVNSIDDARVYKLKLENGKAKVKEIIKSEDGFSYSRVLSEIFDIEEEFGVEVQKDLATFKELRNKILQSKNGSAKLQKEFLQLAKSLAVQSEELQTIVQFELRQLNKKNWKEFNYMMRIVKNPAPEFLRSNYKKWGKRYKAKRENPTKSNDFIWATHEGQKVNVLLLPFLRTETNYHCAFCDGFPLETTGETIEHFRPKASFPLLSYLWANLLYCCKYCNENKGEITERRLIKPNDLTYSFESYFLFEYDTGKIEPNPALTGINKLKAENTIRLYGLNEFNRPIWRKRFLKLYLKTENPDIEDFPYRFIY